MKKLFTIFALLLVSVTGLLFGCSSDRYANLTVVVGLQTTQTDSGNVGIVKKEINGEEKDYLELFYAEPVTILGIVGGMSDINTAVNFTVSDPESLSVTDIYNVKEGTQATLTGLKPTEEGRYVVLKASSIETSAKYTELYIRVVLPVDSIAVKSGLAVTKTRTLTLKDYVSFGINELKYGQTKFTTNQQGVKFSIEEYKSVDGTDLKARGYIAVDETTGRITFAEGATGFAGTLTVKVVSDYKRVSTGEEISAYANISVFEDIEVEDVTYNSPQMTFEYGETNKQDINLYSNFNMSYIFTNETPTPDDDISGEYYREKIVVTVKTTQKINIYCNILNKGDKNIVYVTEGLESFEENRQGNLVSQSKEFYINSRGVAGKAYLNFSYTFAGTANIISYEFADTEFSVQYSGLPKIMNLSQDNQSKIPSEVLTIYDEYKDSVSTSSFGSMISLQLSSDSSSGIINENMRVKFRIKYAGTGDFGSDNFKMYVFNEEGTIVTATFEKEMEGSEVVDEYFLFDLSKTKGNIFYIKALNVSNAEFVFSFENLIGNAITLNNGSVLDPISLQKEYNYTVATKFGVKEMLVMDANDNIVDREHATSTEYAQLMVKKFNGVTPAGIDGSLVNLFANQHADTTNMKIEISDEQIFTIIPVEGSHEAFDYDGNQMTLIEAYSVVGISTGKAVLTVTSANGNVVRLYIQVVEEPSGLTLQIDEAYNNQVITDKKTEAGTLTEVYAIVNGTFPVYTRMYSGASGVIQYNFESSNTTVAKVNAIGEVETLTEGTTTITVTAVYYKFTVVDGYLQWERKSDIVKSFRLIVFIPTTSIKLSTENITVYDSNSLGYEFQDESIFDITVLIEPVNATIYGDPTKVSYSFGRNEDNIISQVPGYQNRFQATLGEKHADTQIVYVFVTVTEFGTSVTFPCKITVIRAVQVEEIKTNVPDFYDTNGEIYYLSLYQGESFDLELTYTPLNARRAELVPVFFEYNAGQVGEFVPDDDLELVTFTDGRLTASPTESGYVFMRVFARDSMVSPISGRVYATILINVSDGSIENPYQIKTVRQLQNIANAPSKHYVLSGDINISSVNNWAPIENFSGSLNGYNANIAGGTYFSILNMRMTSIRTSNVGLFANIVTEYDTIEGETVKVRTGAVLNLKLTIDSIVIEQNAGAGIDETVNVGAIAGSNNGLIMNSAVEIGFFKVLIRNRNVNIGGMVGSNAGTILNFAYNAGLDTGSIVDEGYTIDTHNFDTVIGQYSIVTNIATKRGNPETLLADCVSTNPVNGTITISDTAITTVNAGGIIGYNTGLINGIYGLYNFIQEDMGIVGNSFVATYQNQGSDSTVNINYGDATQVGSITNADSAIGGIAGFSIGKIYNCSADGYIKGNNNVGGIVGKVLGDVSTAEISTVLSSVHIHANTIVGGIAGYADRFIMKYARVESYQTKDTITENTLINAVDRVGGVIGEVGGLGTSNIIEFVYSVSFISDSANGYERYGDIYIRSGTATEGVGGIIGVTNSANTTLTGGYSTLRIVIPNYTEGKVGALLGVNKFTSPMPSRMYFVGTMDLNGKSLASISGIEKYYYYIEFDGVETPSSNLSSINLTAGEFTNANYWTTSGTVQMVVEYGGETYVCPVLVYEFNGVKREFVKVAPETLDVGVKVDEESYDNEETIDDPYLGIIENPNYQTITSLMQNNFAGYKDESGNWLLVLEYSQHKESDNIFTLNDVFDPTCTPVLNRIEIIVESSEETILKLTDDGKMKVLKPGVVTLTFRPKLNYTQACIVTVQIIEGFDDMNLYSEMSKVNNLIENNTTSSTSYKVRVDSEFYPQVEFADEGIVLENINRYSTSYTITTVSGEVFDPVSGDYIGLVYEDGTFSSKTNGKFRVVPVITAVCSYLGNDVLLKITDPSWVFYVEVYKGASSIVVASSSTSGNLESGSIELGGKDIKEMVVSLYTDKEDDDIVINVYDKNNTEYVVSYNAGLGQYVYEYATPTGFTYEETSKYFVPFDIAISKEAFSDGVIKQTIHLAVKDKYKITNVVNDYVYKFSAVSDSSINREVVVAHIPQKLITHSGIHYQYSETVSGEQLDSYSFSSTPTNAVIPGNVGLFEINIYPYYTSINSITISSDVNEGTGSKVAFSQLVRITSTDADGKEYYILAPTTEFLEDGSGIYLDRYSYVDPELAKIDVKEAANKVKTYKLVDAKDITREFPRSSLAYRFDDAYNSKNSQGTDIGKLYVQTIAPSTLIDGQSFKVYIDIEYNTIENGKVVTKPERYTHTLYIDALPTVTLSVKDRESNVIAYTNADADGHTTLGHDSVEFEASVSDNTKIDSIAITDIKSTDGTSKGGVDFSLFATIENGVLRLNVTDKMIMVGDIIVVTASLTTRVENYVSVQTASCEITVVDVYIQSVMVDGLNADNVMSLTVDTSKQLKANITAYGTIQAVYGKNSVFGAEQIMSRCASDHGAILYWQTMKNGNYVNLNDETVAAALPFTVSQIGFSENTTDYNLYIVKITGKTSSGSVGVRLYAPYFYQNGKIRFYQEGDEPTQLYVCEQTFTVVVKVDSNADNPLPIYTKEDLYGMVDNENYILMSDIEIESHTPLVNKKIASLDGNNHIITIKSFAYDPNLQGTDSISINLGLFDTVYANTILKNLIVALPNDKTDTAAMKLYNYSSITFGAIAAINQGVIYNCEVITIDTFENFTTIENNQNEYRNYSYTLNIATSTNVGQNRVVANIGMFVGNNAGNITNSRVGREYVEIVSTTDTSAASSKRLQNVAPVTLMKVVGVGNVAGFVAQNSGTISTSYVNNMQMEVWKQEVNSTGIATAGFVTRNSGYIYGSYAAGWEEGNVEDVNHTFIVTTPGSNILTYVLNNSVVTTDDFSNTRKLGGGIFSDAYVGGFVYENTKYIEDCYSNLNLSGNPLFACNKNIIATINADNIANLIVGGFVYKNGDDAIVKTSYSASKINATSNTHGVFAGTNAVSSVATEGVVDGCYFLIEAIEADVLKYDKQPANPLSDAAGYNLDAGAEVSDTEVNEFVQPSSFASFSFDNSSYNTIDGSNSSGVWAIKKLDNEYGYPELVSANNVATSVRVINVVKTNSETNDYYYNYVEGYEKGSEHNPQVVTTALEFNNLFNDVINANTLVNENISAKFTDNLRLVKNIDFSNVILTSSVVEYTSLINQLAVFDGNYMSLVDIKLSDEATGNFAYGLFRTLNKVGVKCLTLSIVEVNASTAVSVGALAGIIVNSDINNINLVAASEETEDRISGRIIGNNYVGGLAGIIVASDEYVPHKIQNINTNLSIIAGHASVDEAVMTLKPGIIWNKIIPPSELEGTGSANNNLRLQYIPTTYYYAGGLAGAIDLMQASEDGALEIVSDQNVKRIKVGTVSQSSPISAQYTNIISIQGQYAGGIVGFMGGNTMLEDASFQVFDDGENAIISYFVAGGIVAQNYGVVSQTYISFNEAYQEEVDDDLIRYINGETNVTWTRTDFFQGTPTFVGGIVGVNAGSSSSNGFVKDSFNRINVVNENATAIGGIVGASHIGSISNVYTTATVMGNMSNTSSSIGAIIGKVLTDSDTIFCVATGSDAQAYRLNLEGIVAVNNWASNQFDKLYNFVYNKDGLQQAYIGAIYGYNSNEDLIELDVTSSGIYYQKHILKDFTSPYISSDVYDINDIEPQYRIEMFVGSAGSKIQDYVYNNGEEDLVIDAHDYQVLLARTNVDGRTGLRETYFSQDKWKREIWNYADDYILPLLEYGYISDVIRIYTAEGFVNELKKATVSNKLYIIMNDLDFSQLDGESFEINSFSGMLYGNTITYTLPGTTEVVNRKPILYNLEYDALSSALFKSAVNASFANFTIVIGDFEVEYDSALVSTTRASALVENATNTTINNVNVYGNIRDFVNADSETDRIDPSPAKITQGKSILDQEVKNAEFIKLYNPYASTDVFYIYNSTDNAFVYSDGVRDGSTLPDQLSILNCSRVNTNTVLFGGIVANAASVNVTKCSFNIDIKLDRSARTNEVVGASLYVGGIAGNLSGSITNCSVVNASIEVIGTKGTNKYENCYIGGLVGNIQGRISTSYFRGDNGTLPALIRVYAKQSGTDTQLTTSNASYIGTFAGNINTYIANNNLAVGGTESNISHNARINASVAGKAYIGGFIGSNACKLSDAQYLIESKENAYIEVEAAANTELYVGGLIGSNGSTSLSKLYTNVSVEVTNLTTGLYNVGNQLENFGGLIGQSVGGLTMTDVVIDSNRVEVKGGLAQIQGVGGIIGYVNSMGMVTVSNILSMPNISVNAQLSVSIGGAFGAVKEMTCENIIVLGDVKIGHYLSNSANTNNGYTELDNPGVIKTLYGTANSAYFNVGGFIGVVENSFTQQFSDNCVVANSIRNYSAAQQSNLNIGAVIGKGPTSILDTSKVYYNEGISLSMDTAYGKNINQSAEAGSTETTLASKVVGVFENNRAYAYLNDRYLRGLEDTDFYSAFKSEYLVTTIDWDADDWEDEFDTTKFISGTKLNPIMVEWDFDLANKVDLSSLLLANKYVVLKSDILISGKMTNAYQGWVLNCNGYGIYNLGATSKPTQPHQQVELKNGSTGYLRLTSTLFSSIATDSAVSGLLNYCDINYSENTSAETYHGAITDVNNGVVYASGVKGTISANNEGSAQSYAGGLVGLNTGIVTDCFSLIEITARGDYMAVGGLVGSNGTTSTSGQITNSSFTGAAYVTKYTRQAAGGIAGYSEYGYISKVFSIANVLNSSSFDVSELSTANYSEYLGILYPIAMVNDRSPFNHAYYDQNAYIGSHNGLVGDATVYKYGYPVNTGSLEGTEITEILPGKWLNSDEEWADTYKHSSLYVTDESIFLTSSWFNHGYAVKDYRQIVIDGDSITKLLTMLYTGNGKAKEEGVDTTNNFIDKPFIIKHAGLLEIFVLNDNTMEQSFYIANNDLYFDYYAGSTYWAQSWDEKNITFNGDFNGNGKIINNLRSDYGLFRALGQNANVYDFTLNNCYSQTGLIAGYMAGGKIEDITISGRNFVYNKNLNDVLVDGEKFTVAGFSYRNPSMASGGTVEVITTPVSRISIGVERDSMKTIDYVAGGLVGFVNNAILIDGIRFEDDAQINVLAESYAGGFFGVIKGGNIGPETGNFVTFGTGAGMKVVAFGTGSGTEISSGGNAGGIAGMYKTANAGRVSNISLPERVIVYGSRITAGGIAELSSDNSFSGNIVVNNISSAATLQARYAYAFTPSGDVVLPNYGAGSTDSTRKYFNINYVGGVIGVLQNHILQSCSSTSLLATDNFGIYTAGNKYELYVGGVVAKINSGTIIDCRGGSSGAEYVAMSVDISGLTATTQNLYVGGLAGYMAKGHIKYESGVLDGDGTFNASKFTITAKSSGVTFAGGLIGCMRAGVIGVDPNAAAATEEPEPPVVPVTHISNNSTVSSVGETSFAGGIIGQLYIEGETTSVYVNHVNNNAAVKDAIDGLGGIIGYVYFRTNNTTELIISNANVPNGTIGQGAVDGEPHTQVSRYAGGVIGYIQTNSIDFTKIKEVSSNVVVYGMYAGGIIGYANNIQLEGVENTNSINGIFSTAKDNLEDEGVSAGGIIGLAKGCALTEYNNSGLVTASGNYVKVEGGSWLHGYAFAGGIIGQFLGGTLSGTENAINIGPIASSNSATNSFDSDYPNAVSGGIIGYMKDSTGTSIFADIVSNTGSVGSSQYSGGIVGYLYQGTVDNCQNTGSITSNAIGGVAGGIVGYVRVGTIESAQNGGQISNAEYAGGIVGYLTGTNSSIKGVTNLSRATPTTVLVSVSTLTYGGGIVGYMENGVISATSEKAVVNQGMISENESVTKDTANPNIMIGGIVGYMVGGKIFGEDDDAMVTNSGRLNAKMGEDFVRERASVGGIVGGYAGSSTFNLKFVKNEGTILSETGSSDNIIYAGGIIGYATNSTIKILDSVNSGNVGNLKVKHVGGFIGGVYTAVTIENYTINPAPTSIAAITDGTSISGDNAGGLVGTLGSGSLLINAVTIKLASTGGVTGVNYAGGVVGYQGADAGIIRIANQEAVSVAGAIGSNTTQHGGGFLGGQDPDCVSDVQVGNAGGDFIKIPNMTLQAKYAGGVVGYAMTAKINGREFKDGVSERSIISPTNIAATNSGYAGGVVGYMERGSISNIVLANGSIVTGASAKAVGGIVGLMGDTYGDAGPTISYVANGTSNNEMNAGSADYIGGIVGHLKAGTLTSKTTEGQDIVNNRDLVSGTVKYLGGIVGYMEKSTLANIKNKGNITNATSSAYVGGIVGSIKTGTIGNAATEAALVNSGKISAYNAGGLVGYVYSSDSDQTIVISGQNVGDVGTSVVQCGGTVEALNAGGLIGVVNTASYVNVTGRNNGKVIIGEMEETGNAGGIIGKSVNTTNVTTIKSTVVNEGEICLPRYNVGSTKNRAGGFVGYGENIIIEGNGVTAVNTNKVGSGGGDTNKYVARYAGGIVGYLTGALSVIEATNGGAVHGGAGSYVGGIVGYAENGEIGGSTTVNEGAFFATFAKAIGGIVGYAENTSTLIKIAGKNTKLVNGNNYVGGIVGYYHSAGSGDGITTYGNSGGVSANYQNENTGSNNVCAGGIVGYFKTATAVTIACAITEANTGIIVVVEGCSVGINAAGGLVGYAEATADNAIFSKPAANNATVTAPTNITTGYAGGIVGQLSSGKITDASNTSTTGKVTGYHAGGIVGFAGANTYIGTDAKVENSAPVSAENSAGGIVGYMEGVAVGDNVGTSTSNAKNTGAIKGNTYAGGLVGYMYTNSSSKRFVKGINTGSVSYNDSAKITANAAYGGLVGAINHSSTSANYDIIGKVGTTSSSVDIGSSSYTNIAYAGGLIGIVSASDTTKIVFVSSINVFANVYAKNSVGGLIGSSARTVETTAEAIVTIQKSTIGDSSVGAANAGGLIGSTTKPVNIGAAVNIKESVNIRGHQSTSGYAGGLIGSAHQVTIGAAVTISGTSIKSSSSGYAGGLIGSATANFDGVDNTMNITATIEAGNNGGLIAKTSAKILNATVSGTLTFKGATKIGGIIGQATTEINNCHNTATIVSDDAKPEYVGGIAGATTGVITKCSNNKDIALTKNASTLYAGGIVGTTSNTISTSTNEGKVIGTYAGGIVGTLTAGKTLTSLINSGNVGTDSSISAGGLIGEHTSGVAQLKGTSSAISSSSGEIRAKANAGGLVGKNSGDITFEYITNASNVKLTVNGSVGDAGGFVGYNEAKITITANRRCSNIGSVEAASTSAYSVYAGGIVGRSTNTLAIGAGVQNSGSVSATGTSQQAYAGGFAGKSENSTTIAAGSSNSGNISAYSETADSQAGGFVGSLIDTHQLGSSSTQYVSNSGNISAGVYYNYDALGINNKLSYTGNEYWNALLNGYMFTVAVPADYKVSSEAHVPTHKSYAGGMVGYLSGNGTIHSRNYGEVTAEKLRYIRKLDFNDGFWEQESLFTSVVWFQMEGTCVGYAAASGTTRDYANNTKNTFSSYSLPDGYYENDDDIWKYKDDYATANGAVVAYSTASPPECGDSFTPGTSMGSYGTGAGAGLNVEGFGKNVFDIRCFSIMCAVAECIIDLYN